MAKKSELLQGTLDLLVLKTLRQEPAHGYAIAQKILVSSRKVLDVQQGSLYPALHRLEKKGLIESEWREGDNGRAIIIGGGAGAVPCPSAREPALWRTREPC